MLRILLTALLLQLQNASGKSALSHNGYAMQFTPPASQVAGTKALLLDPDNTEIAKLAGGLTISAWLKFTELEHGGFAYGIQAKSHRAVWWAAEGATHIHAQRTSLRNVNPRV